MGAPGRRRFTALMVGHAREHFPLTCAALGEVATAAVVEECVERGGSYGLSTERSLARWVNLAFLFGRRFDVDLPWAAAILRADGTPESKATRLLWAGIRYERLARGLDGEER